MATTSKQFKSIGEDIWKGRTEKIVCTPLDSLVVPTNDLMSRAEFRAVRTHLRRSRSAADTGL